MFDSLARNLKIRNLFILAFSAALIALVPLAHAIVETGSADENKPSGADVPLIDLLQKYVVFVSGIAEALVVVLLWKTVKDFAELAKVSKLQTEVRFRPWIGPSGNIQHVADDSESEKKQYAIAIKNFGEVPSTAVTGMSTCGVTMPKREVVKSENVDKFNLGPLLPKMEKRYWIFLDSVLMSQAQEGTSDLFVVIYFSYNFLGGKSGYGMISQFDRKSGGFIHRDMWLD